jgi:hypothetical protein
LSSARQCTRSISGDEAYRTAGGAVCGQDVKGNRTASKPGDSSTASTQTCTQ